MADLIPYEKVFDGWSFGARRLYPTGKCKKTTITDLYGKMTIIKYAQCRTKIFGIPLWTRWVDGDYISWEKVEEEIFDCDRKK